MPTTLKDIARATGLSTTTVSLVLNGKPHRISKEKCQLIKETAKKMDYHPNRLAVGLIKHETRTVGLILPDITNVFSQRLLRASRMSYGSMDIIYCSVIPMIVMNKRFLLFV